MYYAEALRPYVGAIDPATKNPRKFLFRRDPRDVNRIWFYDPGLREYFEIPILRGRYAGVTVSEYVAAKKKAKQMGRDAIDHDLIERLIEENRQQEIEAAARTKEARKNTQKRTNNAKQTTPAKPKPDLPSPPPKPVDVPGLLSIDDVDTFGDVW